MNTKQDTNVRSDANYRRVESAINYIANNYASQPSLQEIADVAALSQHHFHRLFVSLVGISPKKFTQYVSLNHAKRALLLEDSTLLSVAYDSGFSGASRLHNLFVTIEAMTPGQYKNGGAELNINYSYAWCPFGKLFLASTHRGLCYMVFESEERRGLVDLQNTLPHANYHAGVDNYHRAVLAIFQTDMSNLEQIKLHLRCTPFQLKVWETLLRIPFGRVANYKAIADAIERPSAARAVGNAIAANPISLLIPCHRVIQRSGSLGGYRWGQERKRSIIAWEGARGTDAQAVITARTERRG